MLRLKWQFVWACVGELAVMKSNSCWGPPKTTWTSRRQATVCALCAHACSQMQTSLVHCLLTHLSSGSCRQLLWCCTSADASSAVFMSSLQHNCTWSQVCLWQVNTAQMLQQWCWTPCSTIQKKSRESFLKFPQHSLPTCTHLCSLLDVLWCLHGASQPCLASAGTEDVCTRLVMKFDVNTDAVVYKRSSLANIGVVLQ